MRSRNILRAGAAGLVVACAAAANAQTSGPVGLSVRAGLSLPTGGGDIGFAGGVDYKLSTFTLRSPGAGLSSYLGVSADYYNAGGDKNNIPVALTYNVRQNNVVLSAGVGVDFYAGNNTGTSLGGQLGIAYDFGSGATLQNPVFVAAKYYFTRDSDLMGFGLYVGYRF